MTATTKTAQIARLNDLLRTTFMSGRVLMTPGVAGLSDEQRSAVVEAVQSFKAFTPDNDPYGEHDCAVMEVEGVGRVIWKIAYYDWSFEAGSDDPADPAKTARVLTIMLGEEY